MATLFDSKYEKFSKLLREKKRQHTSPRDAELAPEDIMEKGDMLAMIIAALITIVPVVLVVLVLLALAGYFFVVR